LKGKSQNTKRTNMRDGPHWVQRLKKGKRHVTKKLSGHPILVKKNLSKARNRPNKGPNENAPKKGGFEGTARGKKSTRLEHEEVPMTKFEER